MHFEDPIVRDRALARPAGPPPVYFLLHVPKAAGQTIEAHLQRHAADRFLEVRSAAWPVAFFGRPYRKDGLSDRLMALSGHYLGRSLEQLFPGREIRRTVLLRDPVDLQVSLYNYRVMKYLARGSDSYDFRLHLRSQPRNFITHFLLWRWLEIPWPVLMTMSDTRKFALVNAALARFWFVGDYQRCDELIAAIAPDLDIPPQAPRRNISSRKGRKMGWEPLLVEKLSDEMRRAIDDQHPLDLALWQTWSTAGFAPDAVDPPAARSGVTARFFAEELVRPVYNTVLYVQRWRPRSLPAAPLPGTDGLKPAALGR